MTDAREPVEDATARAPDAAPSEAVVVLDRGLPPLLARLVDKARDPSATLARFTQALTHPTYAHEQKRVAVAHNQRLEFLGDAVLELIVSESLFHALPDAAEGLLSRTRALVVNEASLACAARALGLGAAMRLGRGERGRGGTDKASILADALESIVAAAFLSGGLPMAAQIVEHALSAAIARVVAEATSMTTTTPTSAQRGAPIDPRAKDPKSLLQEIAQTAGGALPTYDVSQTGPVHSATFAVTVALGGEVVGRGDGRSKREAETRAAENALASLTVRERLARVGDSTVPDARDARDAVDDPGADASAPTETRANEGFPR